MASDLELLAQYTRDGSQQAFGELVARLSAAVLATVHGGARTRAATAAGEALRAMLLAKVKIACAIGLVVLAAGAAVTVVLIEARPPIVNAAATTARAAAASMPLAPSPLVLAERSPPTDVPAAKDSVTFANAMLPRSQTPIVPTTSTLWTRM